MENLVNSYIVGMSLSCPIHPFDSLLPSIHMDDRNLPYICADFIRLACTVTKLMAHAGWQVAENRMNASGNSVYNDEVYKIFR